MKRVGIDIGSTTVKIAVLDDNNNILFSAYERHFARCFCRYSGNITARYFLHHNKRTRCKRFPALFCLF